MSDALWVIETGGSVILVLMVLLGMTALIYIAGDSLLRAIRKWGGR